MLSHPKIASALVAGHGRFQAALLIEPKTALSSQADENHLRDELWTLLQDVCSSMPTHYKIANDMIIFAKSDKPFLYTAKGTIRRQMTLDLYRDEFEVLYQADGLEAKNVASNPSSLEERSYTTVRNIVSQEIPNPELRDDTNLLDLGMDSIQATNLAREINRALQEPQLEARTVYSHPSVQDLTAAVASEIDFPVTQQRNLDLDMEHLFRKYEMSLPVTTRVPSHQPHNLTVLLTGSTGSLGTYTIHALFNEPRVGSIYCLNRSEDSEKRQYELLSERGLSIQPHMKQCHWITCDISKARLGLPVIEYKELLSTTTHVLHNAWNVDFNLPLSSFESQIQGAVGLIDFCAHSSYGANLCFTSSVGVALNFKSETPESKIPENVLEDWGLPEQMGYAQSKLIAERLLETGCANAGIDVTVCRVGQIAGPTLREQGIWNPREWLPSLIATSKALRRIPEDLGPMSDIDWIPVDLCGNIVVELLARDRASAGATHQEAQHSVNGNNPIDSKGLSFDHHQSALDTANHDSTVTNGTLDQLQHSSDTNCSLKVRHVVNPCIISWSSLLPTVLSFLPEDTQTVSFAHWVDVIKTAASSSDDGDAAEPIAARIPAIKLLSFYEDLAARSPDERMPKFETLDTLRESEGMRRLEPVDGAWMRGG